MWNRTKSFLCFSVLVTSLAPCLNNTAWADSPNETPSHVFRGNVSQNEVIDNLERLGIKCEIHEGAAHKLTVREVRLGSNAFYKGVIAGDTIIGLTTDHNDNRFRLTISRSGQTYQLSLKPLSGALSDNATPLSAGINKSLLQGNTVDKAANVDLKGLQPKTASTHIPIVDVNQHDPLAAEVGLNNPPILDIGPRKEPKGNTKKLVTYDIELILDITGSMNEADGTGSLSKFQWCHEQVNTIAQRLAPYNKTFTITTFNEQYDTMENCNPERVEQLYRTIKPSGGTDLVDPLIARCSASLTRQKRTGKPQLIAIISDGEPNIPRDPKAVNRALVDFTQRMSAPGEVTITFLQIGDTFTGRDFCVDLDENLVREGAKYDLVHTKTFAELKQEGIIDALIDAIRENNSNRTAAQRHFDRFVNSLPKSEESAKSKEILTEKRRERKELERQLLGK